MRRDMLFGLGTPLVLPLGVHLLMRLRDAAPAAWAAPSCRRDAAPGASHGLGQPWRRERFVGYNAFDV